MSQSAGSHSELEMLWQARLEQAARRHGMANVRYFKVIEEYYQPTTTSSDGQVAILRAIQEADAARVDHMRVLRIFTDLMTFGKLPENESRARSDKRISSPFLTVRTAPTNVPV